LYIIGIILESPWNVVARLFCGMWE
jgi:hypothetical protein